MTNEEQRSPFNETNMENQDTKPQVVTYRITTPKLKALENAVVDSSLPVSKLRGAKYAVKTINHIKSKGVVDVTFKVPTAISEGLNTGKYLRRG